MIAAVLFAIAAAIPGIPLIVLVTRADEIRLKSEALELKREHGLLSQDECDQKKRELLSRRLWHL